MATGPANGLMDAWCQRQLGHAFDAGGAFAAQGQVDAGLLARLLDEPWFAAPPPKSTGRDRAHLIGSQRPCRPRAARRRSFTLLALTAHSVAAALSATQPQTRRVIVCGGGVHNPLLLTALAQALPTANIESSARATAGSGLCGGNGLALAASIWQAAPATRPPSPMLPLRGASGALYPA